MISEKRRQQHREWLEEITVIPTAAGHEDRVVAWIERWIQSRRNLRLTRDQAGNLLLTHAAFDPRRKTPSPVFITAHLDHPAFVVTDVIDERTLELGFRGGVQDPYFIDARIEVFDASDKAHRAVIASLDSCARPFKTVEATLRAPSSTIQPGDIGRWAFPKAVARGDHFYTNACDDLAAVAAALGAIDVLHRRKGCEHIGVLFTRAEEVGFVGALAACKHRSVPRTSRLICLENSRSFPESPIGGGPILRVGDRISVFDPRLTNRLTDIMLEHEKKHRDFKWQRKLMPGGACEATAFSTYGYESTCVCLPLGNYHNMQHIDAVRDGTREARVGREFISISDFHGLIEMLIVCCSRLDTATIKPIRDRMDNLLNERGFVLKSQ